MQFICDDEPYLTHTPVQWENYHHSLSCNLTAGVYLFAVSKKVHDMMVEQSLWISDALIHETRFPE